MIDRRRFSVLLASVAVTLSASQTLAAGKVTVFAAASLKTALDHVSAAWTSETGNEAVISYAASSALAKQIEEGAPADVYMSADLAWMSYLTERNLVAPAGAIALLGNEIVLVAPRDSPLTAKIERNFPLAKLLGGGKLAMADVNAVPAGKYGRAALESLGVWSSVEPHAAQTENVRAALKLVATGEAPLGIVYRSDAKAESAVRVLDTFPAGSHPPIVLPVAVTVAAASANAKDFVAFLQSTSARTIFELQGFTVLTPPATN
jgi:molybdate transport system substrate-binding protein